MEKGGAYLVVGIMIALGVVALYYWDGSPTGLVVVGDLSESDFAEGIPINVSYEGSALILSGTNVTGTYTSKIFDALKEATWNNLTLEGQGGLSFEVRACNPSCTNESFLSEDLGNLNLISQYFQYQVSFTEDVNTTTSLTSVSIDYSVVEVESSSITIHSPLNQTYDVTEINLNVGSEGIANAIWWYNLNSNATNITFTPNATITGVEDTDNLLIVYANDSEGNMTSQSVSFSVSVPSCDGSHLSLCLDETSCDNIGDGYWYDGSCNAEAEDTSTGGSESESGSSYAPRFETGSDTSSSSSIELSSGEIQALSLNSGSSGDLGWIVTNTATNNLETCNVRPIGEFVSWISTPEASASLNGGEEKEFSFSVSVPEGTGEGSYLLSVSLECSGGGTAVVTSDFTVNVLNPTGESQEEIAPEEGTSFIGGVIFDDDGVRGGVVFVLIVAVLAITAVLFVARNLKRSGRTLRDVFNEFRPKLKFLKQ